jgi:hypothetical protein
MFSLTGGPDIDPGTLAGTTRTRRTRDNDAELTLYDLPKRMVCGSTVGLVLVLEGGLVPWAAESGLVAIISINRERGNWSKYRCEKGRTRREVSFTGTSLSGRRTERPTVSGTG